MTPVQSITTCIRKYATFSGRAARSELWWFTLALFALFYALQAASDWAWGEDLLTASDTLDWAILVLAVLVVCPYFAVSVRRFHDVGISGWYFLALSVAATGASFALDYVDVLKTSPSPDLNPLVTPALFEINAKAVALMGLSLLAYLAEIIICLWRGQPQANRYGPNPHEVTP